MKTVVGLFKDYGSAEHALGEFVALGLTPQQIGMLSSTRENTATPMSLLDLPGLGQLAANAPMLRMLDAANLKSSSSMQGALENIGLARDEAAQCVDGIKRGETLEAVVVEDQKEAEALAIMRRNSGIGTGIRERLVENDLVIPIVQEELRVGKREYEAGGMRIETHVASVPVDQTVMVREEHITVERRVVDRSVGLEDEAFRERAIELKATCEEPVFSKQARVVEEIRLHKDTTERVEKVHDTLRHTDVQISEIPATRGFEASRYAEHFKQNFESSGFTLASLAPAYEYGERLRFGTAGDDWTKVEGNARTLWETKNPGTWERFREAIRAGWSRAKD
ncbi:MAG TPA: YsnF/AvaK domain-containing protein [Polyangiaceae bacterium]|nr:YsnF/AvaK domain-containing protein [Polyangiaceae bacterium]